jgi:hypothetical protein
MKVVPFVAHKPISRPYPYGLLIKRVPFRAKLGKDRKWRIYPGLRLGAKRHWLLLVCKLQDFASSFIFLALTFRSRSRSVGFSVRTSTQKPFRSSTSTVT